MIKETFTPKGWHTINKNDSLSNLNRRIRDLQDEYERMFNVRLHPVLFGRNINFIIDPLDQPDAE